MTTFGARPVWRKRGLEHYRLVAEIYLEALEAGLPPQQAVRDTFNVSQGTAAGWVHDARHTFGLIPDAPTAHVLRHHGCPQVTCPNCGGRMRHYKAPS